MRSGSRSSLSSLAAPRPRPCFLTTPSPFSSPFSSFFLARARSLSKLARCEWRLSSVASLVAVRESVSGHSGLWCILVYFFFAPPPPFPPGRLRALLSRVVAGACFSRAPGFPAPGEDVGTDGLSSVADPGQVGEESRSKDGGGASNERLG